VERDLPDMTPDQRLMAGVTILVNAARRVAAEDAAARRYTATAMREGSWWLVSIPDLDGLTQARTLADAELAAREWIAVTLDVPLDTVSVTVTDESASPQRVRTSSNPALDATTPDNPTSP